MASNVHQNPNHISNLGNIPGVTIEGFVDVNSPLVGSSIFNGLWRKLSISSQMQQGDYLLDRSRDLFRRYLQLIELHQHDVIWDTIDELV